MASAFRERRFPPAEVRRIIRRAAELAETDPETSASERALTQDEMVRHGAELGLPAGAVRRAISAPLSPEPSGKRPWLRPRQVLLEQELSGEVPAERHEEIVEVIRSTLGMAGRTEVVGKTITWSFPHASAPVVTIRSKDGRTRVRVEERLEGAGVLIGVGSLGALLCLMAVGVAMDVTRSAAVAGAVASVVMICTLAVAAALAARAVRRREALLELVMERLGAAVGSAVEPRSPPRMRVAEATDPPAASAVTAGPVADVEAEAEVEAAVEDARAAAAAERS